MSSDKELSPEEKLLKVIQQGRQGKNAEVPSPPEVENRRQVAEKRSPPASVGTAEPERRPAAPEVRPVLPEGRSGAQMPERKLKLAGTEGAKVVPTSVSPAKPATAPSVSPAKKHETPLAGHQPGDAGVAEKKPVSNRTVPTLGNVLGRLGGVAAVSLMGVIRVLWVVIVVLIVLTVLSALFVRMPAVPKAAVAAVDESLNAGTGDPSPVMPPLDQVAQLFAQRNMFMPISSPGPSTNQAATVPPVQLKWMGSTWEPGDESGYAAILKDETSKGVYFVKAGEAVGDTGTTVVKVDRDRVTLKREGKEWELK